MASLSEKTIFEVFRRYFSEVGIISHQLDGYNYLINTGLQKIFSETPDIIVENKEEKTKYVAKFGQVYVDRPCIVEENRTINYITPTEARLREIFYEGQVSVDITEETYEDGKKVGSNSHSRVAIAKVPVMIGSCICNIHDSTTKEWIRAGECEKDPGGYFIIKGKERVLISQERINYNQTFVFAQKADAKFKFVSEMRSMSEETGHSVLIQAKIDHNGKILLSLPYVKDEIPAAIVFRALGFASDDEIRSIFPDGEDFVPFVESMIRHARIVPSVESALNLIGEASLHVIPADHRASYAEQVLENELFPHLGIVSKKERAILLAKMISKLILTFLEKRPDDDRDNISLKRVETAGTLIGDLFRMLLKRLIENLKKNLVKRQDIVSIINRFNNITQGLHHCFSTGNWGIQKNTYIRTGVAQILSRLTYSAMISHLRRVVIPIGKEGKDAKIRQLHPTQIGFIDPAETPEGHAVGIVKNLAMTTRITTAVSKILVRRVLEKSKNFKKIRSVSVDEAATIPVVILNGFIIGITENPEEYVKEMRELRSAGVIDTDVSISYDPYDQEITVFCDEGRFIRPFFTIDGDKLLIDNGKENPIGKKSWSEMVKKGWITWVDSNEVENSVLATYPSDVAEGGYNYCELHPSSMLGVVTSTIPFPDHSQAPRNCYSDSMTKQAIGVYALNHSLRADTVVHTLNYPQKPVVTTEFADMFGYDSMPYGINVVISVLTYTGFNQEDSVIINKSAIDRGLFVTNSFKTTMCEEKKRSGNTSESIELPPQEIRKRGLYYGKLGDDGIVAEGTFVAKNDVIIGRVLSKFNKEDEEEKTDGSISIKVDEEGIIDKVIVTTNADGYKMVKIRIRNVRIPVIGDKFASRAGQKGTCGMMYRQEDMPFTASGIVPDVIINPHAFPSRMTINQLLESLLGKKCCLDGTRGDSTPFTSKSDDPVHYIMDGLKKAGMQHEGYETMYNGFTGEQLKSQVFTGVCYYQRLKHMVTDKIHARAFGNVTVLSRQPLEGRSRDGGLRCGEMERDCLIAHGASSFLRERLFNMSDPYKVVVCEKCGSVASDPEECRCCKEDKLVPVNIPYACKLLLQELNAMGIKTAIMPKVK